MEKEHNIFEALKRAKSVGGTDTSMQSPELDEDVLEQALVGHAHADEVVLWLYESAEEAQTYTVGVLQAATSKDGVCWELPSERTIWIF